MSIKASQAVWIHSKADASDLLVLLAIADFADDRGLAWPGQARLGQMARRSDRQVRRIIKKLVAMGELEIVESGSVTGRSNLYRITLVDGPVEPATEEGLDRADIVTSALASTMPAAKGDIPSVKGDTLSNKGDRISSQGGQNDTERVTSRQQGPDAIVSDDPSENHQKIHQKNRWARVERAVEEEGQPAEAPNGPRSIASILFSEQRQKRPMRPAQIFGRAWAAYCLLRASAGRPVTDEEREDALVVAKRIGYEMAAALVKEATRYGDEWVAWPDDEGEANG